MTIRAGGIEAKELGIAFGDARIGEFVRVTLQTSKREVSGRAFANGHVAERASMTRSSRRQVPGSSGIGAYNVASASTINGVLLGHRR